MQTEQAAPAVGWASGPLGAAQAADREIARQTALRARALAAFAGSRPASVDRRPGQPGAMSPDRRATRAAVLCDVSEWAAPELALALSITTRAAEDLLARSLTLVRLLPGTLAALERGTLHLGHLHPMLEKVALVEDAQVRARLERDLLVWMAARDVTTSAQLSAKIRRELLARDIRTAAALGRYADAIEDDPAAGPPRTRRQKMADCLLDLVLRPGETDLPAVQARLTLVAPVSAALGGDAPGEINGEPVPAEMVRALARGLGLLPDLPAAGSEPQDHFEHDVGGEAAERALERWWARVEARALRGEWGGAEDPPLEELERFWAREAAWDEAAGDVAADDGEPDCDVEPAESTEPGAEPSWWAAADRAVDEAGAALLAFDRGLGRARRAVAAASVADAADEDDWAGSSAARMTAAPDAITALAAASDAQRTALRDLLERTSGGGLADRPRIAVTDALTGALLALTDARELRARGTCGRPGCRSGAVACDHDLAGLPGLGPPASSPGYRPGARLDRFLRCRDRRCRFPGCRNRVPDGGELDHSTPWPDGPTSADNLTGFCTGHHRCKHQAPGWRYDLSADGTLTTWTPSGLTASTAPPPF